MYEELKQSDKDRVDEAWLQIAKGVDVYAEVLGVDKENLRDTMNDRLWDQIELNKSEESV